MTIVQESPEGIRSLPVAAPEGLLHDLNFLQRIVQLPLRPLIDRRRDHGDEKLKRQRQHWSPSCLAQTCRFKLSISVNLCENFDDPFLDTTAWRRTRLIGVAAHTFVHYYVHMPQTIRIAPSVHATLATLAKATHTTIAETVSRAVGVYQREVFLRGLADDFAALRASSEQWPGEQAEREAWDQTIADGLENE
jgi:hypothetical protein